MKKGLHKSCLNSGPEFAKTDLDEISDKINLNHNYFGILDFIVRLIWGKIHLLMPEVIAEIMPAAISIKIMTEFPP
jgi:hypothetical protein